jgi:hypothetical protein
MERNGLAVLTCRRKTRSQIGFIVEVITPRSDCAYEVGRVEGLDWPNQKITVNVLYTTTNPARKIKRLLTFSRKTPGAQNILKVGQIVFWERPHFKKEPIAIHYASPPEAWIN